MSFLSSIANIFYSNKQAGKAVKGARDIYGNLKYEEDPIYTEVQDYLKEYGMDMMNGEMNDYYAPIGEYGGKEFEDILGLTRRNTETAVTESLAKQGRARGGQLAASVAPAVADAEITARYEDYTRAMKGRTGLLETGINLSENVRGSAFNNMTNENKFNQDKAGILADLMFADADRKSKAFAGYMGAVDGMANSLIGGLGKIKPKTTRSGGLEKIKPKTTGSGVVGALGKSGDLASKYGYYGEN